MGKRGRQEKKKEEEEMRRLQDEITALRNENIALRNKSTAMRNENMAMRDENTTARALAVQLMEMVLEATARRYPDLDVAAAFCSLDQRKQALADRYHGIFEISSLFFFLF